jgi:hypothetical protein
VLYAIARSQVEGLAMRDYNHHVMEFDIVTDVISSLDSYLEEHLPLEKEFAVKLYTWRLISEKLHETLLSEYASPKDMYETWRRYVKESYNEEFLQQFCSCLKECFKDFRPKVVKVAEKIEAEILVRKYV